MKMRSESGGRVGQAQVSPVARFWTALSIVRWQSSQTTDSRSPFVSGAWWIGQCVSSCFSFFTAADSIITSTQETMKVLGIDPGTSNLGWAFTENSEILEAGCDCIWIQTKGTPIHASLVEAVVRWYREHREFFEQADQIVMELQYVAQGTRGCFPPLIVMEAILTLTTLEWPGKMRLVQAAALKKHFGIRGTYEERKREVQRIAGLDHLGGRIHDIADAVLLVEYNKTKEQRTQEAILKAELREEKRARIRARQAEKQLPHRTCQKCLDVSSERYIKRGTGHICGSCYGKEYRRGKKSKAF